MEERDGKVNVHNINSGIFSQCRRQWSFPWSWKFGWRTEDYPYRNRCEKVIVFSLTLVNVRSVDYIPINRLTVLALNRVCF